MSLLLDALKKAKDEKNEGESIESGPFMDMEIDLEDFLSPENSQNAASSQQLKNNVLLDLSHLPELDLDALTDRQEVPTDLFDHHSEQDEAIQHLPKQHEEQDEEQQDEATENEATENEAAENEATENEAESELSFDLDLNDQFDELQAALEASEQAERESIDNQFSNEFLANTYPEKPTPDNEFQEASKTYEDHSLAPQKSIEHQNKALQEEGVDSTINESNDFNNSNDFNDISPESIKNIIEKAKVKNKKYQINLFIKIFSGVLLVSTSTVLYLVHVEPLINLKKNYRFYIADETAQEVEDKKNKLLDEKNQLIREAESVHSAASIDPMVSETAVMTDVKPTVPLDESVTVEKPAALEEPETLEKSALEERVTLIKSTAPESIETPDSSAKNLFFSKKTTESSPVKPAIIATKVTYSAHDFHTLKGTSTEQIIEKANPIENKDVKLIRLVQEAYIAFHDRNYYHAKNLYAEALYIDSTSRDAILGLAASENKLGHPEKSMAHYRKALENNPEDDLALAGMLQLSKPENSIESISLFKHQLEKNKNSSILNYALGNLYAKEKNWAEACYHYEKSVEISPLNPDYTYNLAVCYDQVQNTEKALDYYRLALQNTKSRDYNFNTQEAALRLQHLEKSIRIKTDE